MFAVIVERRAFKHIKKYRKTIVIKQNVSNLI